MSIRRRPFGVLLLVLTVLCVACSSESSEQIRGRWFDSTAGVYLEFDADGEYMVAVNSDLAEPFEWGSYTFDGGSLTQDTASDSPVCPSTSVTWTVILSDDSEQADLTFVEDSCVPATRSQDLVLIRAAS